MEKRVLVLIALSESGIETIKSTPDLPRLEMEYVNNWKEKGLLENFFISISKQEAVLIFKNLEEIETKNLIESLPYFPFMSKITYLNLNKQF